MNLKVKVVIVTYNRLKYLQRVLSSVKCQSYPIDEIIVIDNGCTDGSREWLDSCEGITVVHQNNVGGSGGFYKGMNIAYQKGCDYIWCMDDDVYPEPTCLEELSNHLKDDVGIVCPKRILTNGVTCYGEVVKFNLNNVFKPLHAQWLSDSTIGDNETVDVEGIAFEGPLIKSDVVTKIGYPNKELFILFDDSDFSYRIRMAGFRVLYCKNAILRKEYFGNTLSQKEINKRNAWKIFYEIRNNSYFHKCYGHNAIMRVIKPVFLLIFYYVVLIKSLFSGIYPINCFYLWTKAYIDGQRGILGKLK